MGGRTEGRERGAGAAGGGEAGEADGAGRVLDEERGVHGVVVREMARHAEWPLIMPLSHLSKFVEVDSKDGIEWTEGRRVLFRRESGPIGRNVCAW